MSTTLIYFLRGSKFEGINEKVLTKVYYLLFKIIL